MGHRDLVLVDLLTRHALRQRRRVAEAEPHVNDAGAEVRGAHPEHFGHFASLPLPDVDGALAELEYAID